MLAGRLPVLARRLSTNANTHVAQVAKGLGPAHQSHVQRHVTPGKLPPPSAVAATNLAQAQDFILRSEARKAPQRIPKLTGK